MERLLMVDTTLQRGDRVALVAALTSAGGTVTGSKVKCPFHDDGNPSGSIYEKDGAWHYHCHGPSCGFHGDLFDVEAKTRSIPVEELLREKNGPRAAAPQTNPAPEPPSEPAKNLRV